jgi:hypothetical protein
MADIPWSMATQLLVSRNSHWQSPLRLRCARRPPPQKLTQAGGQACESGYQRRKRPRPCGSLSTAGTFEESGLSYSANTRGCAACCRGRCWLGCSILYCGTYFYLNHHQRTRYPSHPNFDTVCLWSEKAAGHVQYCTQLYRIGL